MQLHSVWVQKLGPGIEKNGVARGDVVSSQSTVPSSGYPAFQKQSSFSLLSRAFPYPILPPKIICK